MAAKSSKPAGDRPKPSDIMSTLDYYLVTKAPFQLPPNVREWIVKYGPWIDVVMLVLMAPAILLALGISAVALPFAAAAAPGLGLAVIAMVIQIGLLVLALPGHEGNWCEAGCDRRLLRRGSEWIIESLRED